MKYALLAIFILPVFLFQNCAERNFSDLSQESLDLESLTPLPQPSQAENIPQVQQDLPPSSESCIIKGQGTDQSPYIIDHECQIPNIPNQMLGYWILNKDLNFTSTATAGIERTFIFNTLSSGVFDGQNHKITFTVDCKDNLDCASQNTQSTGVSIFRGINRGATLRNISLYLTVKNLTFPYISSVANVGSVATASNSFFSKVQAKLELHGMLGTNTHNTTGVASLLASGFYNDFEEIDGSLTVDGHFSPYAIGVIVGKFCESSISNSTAKGDVDGGYFIGGLTGGCGNGGDMKVGITNSWYEGNLSHRTPVDGHRAWPGCNNMSPFGSAQGLPPGENSRTDVTNSYWLGSSAQCQNELPYTPLLSRSDLQTQLSSWDSNIWTIQNGESPKLKWIMDLE